MFEAKKNEKSRKELISLARECLAKHKENELICKGLQTFIGILRDYTSDASKKTAETDGKIKTVLADIAAGKQDIETMHLCSEVINLAVERMKKENSHDEQIDSLRYKIQVMEYEFELSETQLQNDPYNRVLEVKLRKLRGDISHAKMSIDSLLEIRDAEISAKFEAERNRILHKGSEDVEEDDSSDFSMHTPSSEDLEETLKLLEADRTESKNEQENDSDISLDDLEEIGLTLEAEMKSEVAAFNKEKDILGWLIKKRETADAEERAVIDSDISHHNALLQASQSKIQDLSRQREENDSRIVAIMESIGRSSEKDQQYGGNATSVDGSVTGVMVDSADKTKESDSDKYKELEKKLGLL